MDDIRGLAALNPLLFTLYQLFFFVFTTIFKGTIMHTFFKNFIYMLCFTLYVTDGIKNLRLYVGWYTSVVSVTGNGWSLLLTILV